LPPASLALLAATRATGPPAWHRGRAKILVVAVVTLILDFRLLRGNLAGRFADVSVPIAILAAWVFGAGTGLADSWRSTIRASIRRGARMAIAAIAVIVLVMTGAVLAKSSGEMVETSRVLDGYDAMTRASRLVTRLVERTWPLDSWSDATTGQVGLAKYLMACTGPDDRVLMGPLLPPVLALAQRGFAGGRLDLRAGFFDTPEEQRLTVARLERQSVPIVIGPPSAGLEQFARELPIIAAHVQREYENYGDKDAGDGLTFSLLVRRGMRATRTYAPLSLPCFR
jgi:hypothetical protein